MIPEPIRAKLRKLALLLSSPEPNEALAARDAIDRLLRANGADWHAFAELIEAPAPPPPPAQEPSQRYGGARPWQAVAETYLTNASRFTEKEQKFLHDMAVWHSQPSKKQLDWFVSLHQRNNQQWADVS